MDQGDRWSFAFKLRIAAGLVLIDCFPDLAGRPKVQSEALTLALVARWFDREIPADIDRWRRRFERFAELGPVGYVLGLRIRRAMAEAQRCPDPLLGVNIGPGVRFANDLAVAAAVDACLSGGRAVALPWNETGVDLTPLVDVAVALDSEAPVPVDSADQVRLVVEAWGPGAKGVMTVRTEVSPRMRVINVVNEQGSVTYADYTLSQEITASGAVRPGNDPFVAGQQALDNIVTSSPFTSVRLWRTADLPGAQGLPDDLFELSIDERRRVLAERLQPELACHPDGEAMLDEVVGRVEFLRELRYTRWLIRQIQLGALTLLPGQMTAGDGAPPTALTAIDGVLIDLVVCGLAIDYGGSLEVTVPDNPEVRRRLRLLGEVLIRHGAVDGLPEGYIEARIPRAAQHQLTAPDRGYRPPLPALDPPTRLGLDAGPDSGTDSGPDRPRRSMSWIDANRAKSPGSRKTNCWFVASAVASYLTDGAVSIALPKYVDPVTNADLDTVTRLPDYLALIEAGSASFVETKTEAEMIARSWGPGQHGVIAATLNRDSTHLFNVLYDGKEVRFIDGYAGFPGDFQFGTTWERIGLCHVGPLDPRFNNPPG